MLKNKICATIAIFILVAALPQATLSMSSQNFQIFADTINYGGGKSTSGQFIIFDSIGESGIFNTPTSTSANYGLSAGFHSMNQGNYISVNITPDSVNLGNLSPNAVATGDLTLQIATNATFGYSSTIVADGSFRQGDPTKNITSVADGQVSAGVAEYGIRTSGSDGQFNSADQGISTSPQIFASRSNPTNLSNTTITFKASVAASTPRGDFSQSITITTTPHY